MTPEESATADRSGGAVLPERPRTSPEPSGEGLPEFTPVPTPEPTATPADVPPYTPTPSPTPTPTPTPVGAACPVFASAVNRGTTDAGLPEASGIVASQQHPGLLWAHNDSGSTYDDWLFLMNSEGKHLARYLMGNGINTDMEDIAIGPGPISGTSYLYLADIGDNSRQRSELRIYRALEPTDVNQDPDHPDNLATLPAHETLRVRYPDDINGVQRKIDAETLLVDPYTGDLFIVTKNKGNADNGNIWVFRYPAPQEDGVLFTLEEVGGFNIFDSAYPGSDEITGGDISAGGNRILLRSYNRAFLYFRNGTDPDAVADAFNLDPCTYNLHAEPQGEAIAFQTDALGNVTGFFTLSEGQSQPLYFYPEQ